MEGTLRTAAERIGRWLRPLRRPAPALAAMMIAFVAAAVYLSSLRAEELQTTTWDMGIYQQALWSAAHGHTFYEAADLETGGYHSLLQVHSVFLLYALAPVYGALPFETTLFVIQALLVALAALPLYALARSAGGSPTLGLLAAAMYLTWTATLSSALYDFHAEAFLPVEFLAVFYLWHRGRYVLGLAAAAVGFATIEIAPVLLFFVGLYGLFGPDPTKAEGLGPGRAGASDSWRHRLGAGSTLRGQASVALAVASVVAYAVLLWVRTELLATELGVSPLVQGSAGYLIGGTPWALGLSLANVAVGFGAKLTYWVLLLALLGFVPFLAPRALVLLSAPWFLFTLLSANTNLTELGFQYGFIAAGPLLAAFALGLPRPFRWARGRSGPSVSAESDRRAPRNLGRLRADPRAALAVAFVLLVAVNLLLTPADPAIQNQGWGGAYRVS